MYFKILFPIITVWLLAIELPITFILIRRRLYREVPWFTIYTIFLMFKNVTSYWLYASGDRIGYYYFTWMAEGIAVAMAFMVILEVFRISVAQFESVRRVGIKLLIIAAILSIVIALILVPYGANFSIAEGRFLAVAERSLRIIQLALLAAMFAASSYLALSWRHYVFGIALGYGLYAAASLACQTFVGFFGSSVAYKTSLVDSGAYCCTVAIWLIYLLQPEAKGPGLPTSAKQDLRDWSEALSDLGKGAR